MIYRAKVAEMAVKGHVLRISRTGSKAGMMLLVPVEPQLMGKAWSPVFLAWKGDRATG